MDSIVTKPKTKHEDLRSFLLELETHGALRRISKHVSPHLEMTEVSQRTLENGGPALLFTNTKDSDIPLSLIHI